MVFTNKDLNKNTYTLGEVANFLSVHPKTLQKKDREGLIPFDRTSTNRRFLTIENLIKLLDENNLFYDDSKLIKHDVIYARVSKDSKGNIYNADLNGAGNIMRKVSDKAYKNIGKTRELIQRPILVTL